MKKLLLAFITLITLTLQAQDFEATSISIMGIAYSELSWADFDNDNDLDLLIAGQGQDNAYHTILYENNAGNFENTNIAFVGMKNPSMEWGDYDNDGDVDLLLSGVNSENKSFLYKNNGGDFSVAFEMPYLGEQSVLLFIDINNDGYLDIFAAGQWHTYLYESKKDGSFEELENDFPLFNKVQADAGDYDNDGDNDILICGETEFGKRTYIIKNHLDSLESVQTLLPGSVDGDLELGDYDNDGDLDLFMMGVNNSGQPYSVIYRNDGDDVFVDIYAGVTSAYLGKGAWGDYDNDGDLDLITTGHLAGCGVAYSTFVYQNIGNDWFNVQENNFIKGEFASVAWGDYDLDGDLDVVISGVAASSNYFTEVYENGIAFPVQTPSIPEGLSVSFESSQVRFSWNPSIDFQTASEGLTYNLRIGSTIGGSDIICPSSTDSFLLIPDFGNVGHDTTFLFSGLESEETYFWSVQAVENSFQASDFSEEQSFTVDYSSINESSSKILDLYPNPSSSTITFAIPQEENINSVHIYNVMGSEIYSDNYLSNELDISEFPVGIYTIVVEGEEFLYSIVFMKK